MAERIGVKTSGPDVVLEFSGEVGGVRKWMEEGETAGQRGRERKHTDSGQAVCLLVRSGRIQESNQTCKLLKIPGGCSDVWVNRHPCPEGDPQWVEQ